MIQHNNSNNSCQFNTQLIIPLSKNSTRPNINGLKSTYLITLKSFIERCCQSINEIRFYFEFQQLSKHLLKFTPNNNGLVNESGQSSSGNNPSPFSPTKKLGTLPQAPNITNNIDFKSSQILGSIKAIYLLVVSNISPVLPGNSDESTLPGTDGQNNKSLPKTEDYSLFKFKLELKIFLVEIIDYLKVQMLEMNSFITNHSVEPATDTTSNENEAKKNANTDSGNYDLRTENIDLHKKGNFGVWIISI